MSVIPDKINLATRKKFKRYNVDQIDEEVTLYKVYTKHNGVCQSCGILTKHIHPPRPNSASVEHITPLSKGGSHTWDNVTLLCFKCNTGRNTERIREENKKYKSRVRVFRFFGFKITIQKETV